MPTADPNESLYECLDQQTKKEIAISQQSNNFVRIYAIKLSRDWSSSSLLPELSKFATVAMKEITRGTNRREPNDICEKEYNNLKDLSHENIVIVYDLCLATDPEDPSSLPSYLMEMGECSLSFIFRGKLQNSSYIVPAWPDGSAPAEEHHTKYYTKDHLFTWLKQVASALIYLHSKNLLHRDVKGSNVLLFNSKTLCKLCDFDTCRVINPTGMTPKVGTDRWRAPELRKLSRDSNTAQYSKPSDCYSFGVLMCEALFRNLPFSDYPDDAFLVCDQDIPDIPDEAIGAMRIRKCDNGTPAIKVVVDREKSAFRNLPNNVWHLIDTLLSWTPADRPDFAKVMDILSGLSRDADLPKIRVGKERQQTDTGYLANTEVPSRRRRHLTKRVTYSVSAELDTTSQDRIITVLRDFSGNISVMARVSNERLIEVRHEFTFQSNRELTHDIKSVDKQLIDTVCSYCSTERKFTEWMDGNFEADPNTQLRGLKFEVVREARAVE